MPTTLQKLFADYQSWYRTKYVPSIREDDSDGDDDPLAALEPVTQKAIASLEARVGRLPTAYKGLLTRIGAGILLCANDEEPTECTLLPPSAVAQAQKDLQSWLSPEAIVRAEASQRLDAQALVPFLTTDGTTWAVLAGQANRVYLTSHDWEQRDDFDLFAGPLTLEAFFEHFFAHAKKLDPLNGSYDHRGALLRRARRKAGR